MRPQDDPYRHTDYTGKYQMAAFFSDFIWSALDLIFLAYMLNTAHIYQVLCKDDEDESESVHPQLLANAEQSKVVEELK